jgi:hypothetical protein
MFEDTRRYFIELQISGGVDVPRHCEAEVRRAQAQAFVGEISQWLQDQELKHRVASIAVTALGQVLITCEQDIIGRIRQNESLNIAAIRSGATLSESVQRVSGW